MKSNRNHLKKVNDDKIKRLKKIWFGKDWIKKMSIVNDGKKMWKLLHVRLYEKSRIFETVKIINNLLVWNNRERFFYR